MENLKIEFRYHRQNMVKYIGLDGFIDYPIFDGWEKIEFHRNTFLRGLQVSYHADHLFVHFRKTFEVALQIGTEYTQVSLTSAIY